MYRHILTFIAITRLSSAINQNLTGMATFFQHYFAGTENLRIISIILLLLAFILFLFLIVILYIKSLLSFIKENEVAMTSESKKSTTNKQTDTEFEKELTKELERVPQSPLKKKNVSINKERPNVVKKQEIPMEFENVLPATNMVSFQKEKTRIEKQLSSTASFRGNASLSEFDWRTGRLGELDEAAAGVVTTDPQPNKNSLIGYAGLILDMLGIS